MYVGFVHCGGLCYSKFRTRFTFVSTGSLRERLHLLALTTVRMSKNSILWVVAQSTLVDRKVLEIFTIFNFFNVFSYLTSTLRQIIRQKSAAACASRSQLIAWSSYHDMPGRTTISDGFLNSNSSSVWRNICFASALGYSTTNF